MTETRWADMLPDVLEALEADGILPAESRKEGRDEVRYGSRGSLAVNVRRGTFRDHEAGEGGGVLALVQHVGQFDRAAALGWLAEAGLIERAEGSQAPVKPLKRPKAPARPVALSESLPDPPRKQDARVSTLMAASEALPWTDEGVWPYHPAFRWRRRLLAGCGIVDPLRWVARNALGKIPGVVPAPLAAGALLTPRQPLAAWLAGAVEAVAVELEYVAVDGGPVEDAGKLAKRTYGVARGTVWSTGFLREGRVHVAEGVADALTVARHLRVGEDCAATGGTSGLRAAAEDAARAGRDLVIHADADGPGAEWAHKAEARYRALAPGGEVRVLAWTPDPDGERRTGTPPALPLWLYSPSEEEPTGELQPAGRHLHPEKEDEDAC